MSVIEIISVYPLMVLIALPLYGMPYLAAMASPSKRLLLSVIVFVGTVLLYLATRPRQVPCGISGNPLNIPELQDIAQSSIFALMLGGIIRFLLLFSGDVGAKTSTRWVVTTAGAFLLPLSGFMIRVTEAALNVNFCFN